MTPKEKQIISSILNTLTDVSCSDLIEAKKTNNATNDEIELLENNRRVLHDLIERLIIEE